MGMRFIHGGQDIQVRIRGRHLGLVKGVCMVSVDRGACINDMLGSIPTVENIMTLHNHPLFVVTKLIERGW